LLGVPLPDDDRRALASRLATTAAASVDVVAEAVEDDDELREVLVDVDGEVVAFTRSAVLFVGVGEEAGRAQQFAYGAVDVRRRDGGLGVDATVEGVQLVLEVARSTFVRLGVVVQGNPPGRASWLPVRTPPPRPQPEPQASMPPIPPVGLGGYDGPPPALPVVTPPLPPPGWHPDPSGRHWWRWWDGRDWTDHVADGGAPYTDPLPPR
jgi:hypothetical protein